MSVSRHLGRGLSRGLSRNQKTMSLATKTAELAWATPQVMAHRITRMALSGPTLSARDKKEFDLMSAEKVAAFTESWNAMAMQALQSQRAMAMGLLGSFWSMSAARAPSVHSVEDLQRAALDVLAKGMAPVHRTATANARRLARTKLR